MTTAQVSSTSEIVRKQREYLFPAVAMMFREPLAIVRGEGTYVWDDAGRRYLDAFGGILTVSVGHANPHVVAAIVEQVKNLSHCSALYANAPQADLAEKLAAIAPGRLKKSFFTNSGTEANETALAAVRHATGRSEVVVLRHGYSGRAAQTLSASGQSPWKTLPSQVAGFVHAHAPYCYRCPFKLTFPACDLACADDLEELIRTSTKGEIAAFLAETILGSGGVICPPPGYFERAVGIARKFGGLFIADEVQAGWGRTGDKWFGIEHWNVEPDVITAAKGMANGTPIGLTIATPEVADKLPGLTLATFGGNPVSMAAGRATIEVIEQDDLRTNARVVGAHLREKLVLLQEKHPLIGDVRGLGLMQGMELVKDRQTKEPATAETMAVLEAAKSRGALVGKGGIYGNVIRVGLPLNTTADQVDELFEILDASFAAV